jgi:type IV pilus assembly protein PilM
MFFSKKSALLGVDIGTTSIKIVQLTSNDAGTTHTLDTYGIAGVSFDVDSVEPGSIEKIAAVLSDLVHRAGVTTNRVVASMSNSAIFTSVIELPTLTESELGSAVQFEAKKYIPLPIEEVNLSWTVLDKTPDGKTVVLITAAQKSLVASYQKIFQLAHLSLESIDIEALALIRSVVGDDKGSVLLVDIGAKTSHLNIVEKGNLLLTRNVPVGGETITNAIARSLQVTYARAEQFKKDFGIKQESVIPATIKPILTQIKGEVRQLISIYQARSKKFDKLVVCGGGANLPGLDAFFGDLGPAVIHGDPLSRISYSPNLKSLLDQYSGSLAVAIGLALRKNVK